MSTRLFVPLLTVCVCLCLTIGCQQRPAGTSDTAKDTRPAKLPTLQPGEAVATLAGGCFWCVEAELELLKGVREVVSGYAGGTVDQPTYEQVGSGQTGHTEAVQVYYDPKVISFDTLLTAFFAGHDPTTLNRQGPDVGTQYRSVAFYRTAVEKAAIDAAIDRENRSGHHSRPVVTQVETLQTFFPAEVYHQQYYQNHPDELYVRNISVPKVEKFREKMAAWLR